MEMHVNHSQDGSTIKIDKDKMIGIENEAFQNLIQESLDNGSKNIIVDLSNVKFVSSWGIGILVHAYTTCINRQARFSLRGVNSNVVNVLNNLKLTSIFNIV